MKIGFDIDNTLIDYSPSIRSAASDIFGLELPGGVTKAQAVDLLKKELGAAAWTELQGYVYAEYAIFAKPFANALQCLRTAIQMGMDVNLVSHKSKYPASNRQVNLRDWAIRMLDEIGILDEVVTKQPLAGDTIHLCETFEDKITTIENLKFDFFIDDLVDVLTRLDHNLQRIHIFCESQHVYIPGLECVANWNEVTTLITRHQYMKQPPGLKDMI